MRCMHTAHRVRWLSSASPIRASLSASLDRDRDRDMGRPKRLPIDEPDAQKVCSRCCQPKLRPAYSSNQWAKPDGDRRCTECVSADDVARIKARSPPAQTHLQTASGEAGVEVLAAGMATLDVGDATKSGPTDGSRPRGTEPARKLHAFAPTTHTAELRSVVTVGNLSGGKKGSGPTPAGFTDIRIDRQSALGNPFPMGADGHDESFRDAVCEACVELLEDPARADVESIAMRHGLRVDSRFGSASGAGAAAERAMRELEARLRAGENLRLLCWCAPKRCHGNGIAEVLVQRVEGAKFNPRLHNAGGGGGGGGGGGKGAGPPGGRGGRGTGRGAGDAGTGGGRSKGKGRPRVSRLQGGQY